MDTTDCLGLPYPECEPPLTKDASDIKQLRDLAEATDAAVQTLADSISDTLLNPPCVRMLGSIVTAGQDVVQPYNGAVSFDNANMADTAADAIRIQQDGWYAVGGSVNSTSVNAFIRIEPLVNGDTVSSRQGYGASVGSGDRISFMDVLFLRTDDLVTTMTHHTLLPATVYTYNTALWAYLVLGNV
jgi:hypothetical protein